MNDNLAASRITRRSVAMGRIATLREQKCLDPDIIETYFWAYYAEYFST